MEEDQPGSAATHDTASTENVDASSFLAAGDRLPVHLNSSCSTAFPGKSQNNHKQFQCSCGGARTSGEKHHLPVKRKLKHLSSKPGLVFSKFSSWRMNFSCQVSSCASRPIEAMVWITGATIQTHVEFLHSKIASGLKKIINGNFRSHSRRSYTER